MMPADVASRSAQPRALVSWSSGKDSAWALHTVRERGDLDVVGLLTTFNTEFDRASMQGVRRELVEKQAERVGLPIWSVELPWPCSNEEYEERMSAMIEEARLAGVTNVVFGDLFLEDIRAYRVERLAGTAIDPVFPIWCGLNGTRSLAEEMINAGMRAVITALDSQKLDRSFAGRIFDMELLADLPAGVDPLGENGEFHTFCYAGPLFDPALDWVVGEVVDRDGFIYADLS